MSKNSGNVDEAEETMELDGAGNKDGTKNATRQRRRSSRNKRVKIIGIVVAVVIVIVIIVGAWFIYTSLHGRSEWLETIPGLHYRPANAAKDSLITYEATKESSYRAWVDVIDDFLEDYKEPFNGDSNYYACDYDNLPSNGKICFFDVTLLAPCLSENLFGYQRQAPCIFLKIHKFLNWVPEYYNSSNLPDAMDPELKHHILETLQRDSRESQTIWVSCEGVDAADRENIGPVTYYPTRGFPGYYFPASDDEKYLSPLVAIHLVRPRLGIVINIECKLWASNIVHDSEKGTGLVKFELLID